MKYKVTALLSNGKFEVLHRCNSISEAQRVWLDHFGKPTFTHVWWGFNR